MGSVIKKHRGKYIYTYERAKFVEEIHNNWLFSNFQGQILSDIMYLIRGANYGFKKFRRTCAKKLQGNGRL